MPYDSSSFSRSSSSSSSSSSQEGGGDGERRRKLRKRRRKTMTADDMRKGVTFQTGLTGKAKLALVGVVLAGIALTIVVMMAVNGSFSFKALSSDENPENSKFGEDEFGLDAFEADGSKGLAPAATGTQDSAPMTPMTPPAAAPQPADDISKAFEE
jgi:hypothetical protein